MSHIFDYPPKIKKLDKTFFTQLFFKRYAVSLVQLLLPKSFLDQLSQERF
jgi:hypothetical protein